MLRKKYIGLNKPDSPAKFYNFAAFYIHLKGCSQVFCHFVCRIPSSIAFEKICRKNGKDRKT